MTSTTGSDGGGGLVRTRLLERFAELWSRRLAVVVAPAGSGKTTLLAQVAESAAVPVAWYGAEEIDGHPPNLLFHLRQAFEATLGEDASHEWTSVPQAVAAIGQLTSDPVLLVVDDLHRLEGTEAEILLERLVDHAPPGLAVVAATRIAPAWNISRRRVANQVIEVGGDDLRFRSWEVEHLFRHHYRNAMDPSDSAALTRQTEGWAAALQLFHLAAQRKSPMERHRMVTSMGTHLRLVREYLARNVFDELAPDLRSFLLDTCVLGRLRADLCDELRDRPGSAALLAELERRQLVSWSEDDGGWFRAHEVLRSHLETSYLHDVVESERRARYRFAGSLLESAGALSDSLRAYCQAEDWDAAGRLLGHKGEELAHGPAQWLEGEPPALLYHDPWLLLTEARRRRAAGQLTAAVGSYQRAERAMPDSRGAELCRRERAALVAMLDPGAVRLDDWSGVLRQSMTANPLEAHRRCADSNDARLVLVAGLAALAAGCPATAIPVLARVVEHANAGPVEVAAARLGLAVAALLSGREPASVDEAAETLESLGVSGLTRIAAALRATAAGGGADGELAALTSRCANDGDLWGEAVVIFLHGWSLLAQSRPDDAADRFDAAALRFDGLGAEVPEALAAALRAMAGARSGRPEATADARRAEVAARLVGSYGAEAVAVAAGAEIAGGPGGPASKAARLAGDSGLVIPEPSARSRPRSVGAADDPPPVGVRCFGGFVLTLDGRPVELGRLKPKARKVLRYLGMHCPEWVHREVLMEAVWPGADPVAGARNLQVVVSTLRRTVDPTGTRGHSLISREGPAYRLALPAGAWIDHVAVDHAVASARKARLGGDRTTAKASLLQVLEFASGPFLPEDGPDEWVLSRREHYRSKVVFVAESLAEILIEEGAPADAVDVCRRGLAADRCSDRLWRLLIQTCETLGDLAASVRARQEYASVLADLGVG